MEDSLTSGFATATELTHSMDCRSLDKQWCISLHCLWFPEHAGILCSVTCSHQTNTMPRLAWQPQARQDYSNLCSTMEKGEKEMATHSSSLAWKIPWTEEPGGYSSWGCRVSHD